MMASDVPMAEFTPEPMPEPMLEARDLVVERGGDRLLTVDWLRVDKGETLAVMGPNGAGKSTLILCLALLLQPTRGEIRIAGEVATPARQLQLRRQMAVVFQEPLLLDTTVDENVATGLGLRGIGRREAAARVGRWLARFGIAHLASRSARQLSGGEAQRTSLARAFALDPEVVFLDEPFSALDAPTRTAVTADLQAALRATGTTAVLVTHDRDEALALGDRVGVLIRGALRQVGPPEEVFGAPVDTDVAELVGVETIVPGTVVGSADGLALVQAGGSLVEVVSDMPIETPVYLCLRPEDVTLSLATEGEVRRQTSARNRVVGRVRDLTAWKGQIRVGLDCGFALAAAITRRSSVELGLAVGTPVAATFKATSAHLIPRVEHRHELGGMSSAMADGGQAR